MLRWRGEEVSGPGRVRRRLGPPGAVLLAMLSLLALGAAPAAAAARWLAPVDLSAPQRDAANADVAMDDAGNSVAVWQRAGATTPTVQASVKPAGGGYSAPLDLAAGATAPRVAMTPSGEAVVVFNRFQGGGNAITVRIRPPGGAFGAAMTVAALGSGFSVSPVLAVNAAGDAAAVWLGREEGKRVVQASTRPAGGAFSPPVTLSDPAHDASEPQVAVGPAGQAMVVWRGQSGEAPNVIRFSSGSGTGFSAPVDVSSADAAFAPKVAVGPDGEPTVAWVGQAAAEPEAEPPPSAIEAATRSGAGFAAPVQLSQPGLAALQPALAIAPSGEAVAVWTATSGADLVVQAAVRPPGGSFSAPAGLSAAGANAERPRLAVNAHGGFLAAWQRGSPAAVQAAMRPPGAGFGAAATVSAPGQPAILPEAALSGSGDAAAVWLRTGGADDVAQVAGYDGSAPVLRSVAIPALATVGAPVGFAADPFDVWPLASTLFSFGDGAVAAGSSAAHAYAAPGVYPVTFTATDAAGNAVSGGGAVRVVPSYAFRLGKHRRNRRRGIVVIAVHVSAPGRVVLAGRQVKRRVRRSAAAGTVRFPVLARRKALKRLRRKGKARVRVLVAFRPDGGDRTVRRRILVVLIKKHRKPRHRSAKRRFHARG